MKLAVRAQDGADWMECLARALERLGSVPPPTRAQLRAWIKGGEVRLRGRAVRLADPVESGWVEFSGRLPAQRARPEAEQPHVVWRDQHLLVMHKPAGLLTHVGADRSRPDLVSWVRAEVEPTAVLQHRLDADTSGLVLFTLSDAARAPVAQAFERSQVRKLYLARVTGRPPRRAVIDLPLGESKGRVRVDPAGKPSLTWLRCLHQEGGQAWLLLWPRSGRKHQLRVHCSAQGFPILGDALHGGVPDPRLWLHAWKLGLMHPVEARAMEWVDAPGEGWRLPSAQRSDEDWSEFKR